VIIYKEIEIDMGHAVTHHESKCKHLHGHRYKIVAGVEDKVVARMDRSNSGMVIDFGDLKKALMQVIDAKFDHAFVLWEKDPRADLLAAAHDKWYNDYARFHLLPFIPTAENLAAHWFDQLRIELYHMYSIKLVELIVYETPSSHVICRQEDADYFLDNIVNKE